MCAFNGLYVGHLKSSSLLKIETFFVLIFNSTLGREFKFLITEKCVLSYMFYHVIHPHRILAGICLVLSFIKIEPVVGLKVEVKVLILHVADPSPVPHLVCEQH